MDNKSLIHLVKKNLNEFMDYLNKNNLDEDPDDGPYFITSEGIKLPFLMVAEMWRMEKEKTLKATK